MSEPLRPTPETDAAAASLYEHRHDSVGTFTIDEPSRQSQFVVANFARLLEQQRDELQEHLNINATLLLKMTNERNSLGNQLDLVRDELLRIEARIREAQLEEHPKLADVVSYCQRAQQDIKTLFTPIEERDRLGRCLRVTEQQRDELLEALENLLFFHDECGMQSGHGDKARAAIAAVKGAN